MAFVKKKSLSDRQGVQLFDRKGMKAKLPTREQSGMPGSRQPNAGGWDSGVGCRWQADDGANVKVGGRNQMSRRKDRLSEWKWEGMGGRCVVCPGGCTATPSGAAARTAAPTHPPAGQPTYRERVCGEVEKKNCELDLE